jgi:hypothetical protein
VTRRMLVVRPLVALIGAAALAACAAEASSRTARDTSRAATLAMQSSAEAARGACDAAAAAWESAPADTLTRGDTLVQPVDLLGQTLLDPSPEHTVAACFVNAYLETGDDSAAVARGASWLRAGWSELPRLSSGGGGGRLRTYQRGRTRCEVLSERDSGDDEDPSYEPDPFQSERVTCWQHWRDMMPSDTARAAAL